MGKLLTLTLVRDSLSAVAGPFLGKFNVTAPSIRTPVGHA